MAHTIRTPENPVETLLVGQPDFPERLTQIPASCRPGPCTRLYVQGHRCLLSSRCIAIIGTRHPTDHAMQIAHDLAYDLAQEGYTIVAGLADGIDTAAHWGALDAGGNTIAVLGTTLLPADVYPRSNSFLAAQIALKGLLITEYQQKAYDPARFFERDRLQAALSDLVIPVQCGTGSGTLHTVRAALSMGIPVWAPRPQKEDYHEHPTQYAGLIELFREGSATPFTAEHWQDMLLSVQERYLAA